VVYFVRSMQKKHTNQSIH